LFRFTWVCFLYPVFCFHVVVVSFWFQVHLAAFRF
jgi:hypothetical protein